MVTEPFDITEALKRVGEAIRPFPPAALFALRDEGFNTLFEQLVACVISVRTRDEVTLVIARRVFGVARTPAEVLALSQDRLESLLRGTTFLKAKVKSLHEIARIAQEHYQGHLPDQPEELRQLPGIGPKCAHLALSVALGYSYISVDVHVHRVTYRWGYVHARSPELALRELETKLPRKHWIEINALLVPFGKHICRGDVPLCESCPLNAMCPKRGVTRTGSLKRVA